MDIIGKLMLYFIMFCCLLGAVAAVIREESGLGRAFEEGLQTVGSLFLPLTGLMISVPYLSTFVDKVLGPVFRRIGADPAVAATTLIPSDVGGYLLARQVASSPEAWIMAMVVGIMAAPIISFNIPVGLSILEKEDYPFLALGALAGIISIPIGVLTALSLMYFTQPFIRPEFAVTGPATYQLAFQFGDVLLNLAPLTLVCVLLALGLKYFPNKMIKAFMYYGKLLMSALKLIVACAIVEYYTGLFANIFGSWGFSPILADDEEKFRAIELLGTIGMMLAGAFPMVYLLQKYLKKPLTKLGSLIGLSPLGSAGILGASANALAMFSVVKGMPPADKVMCIAFSVCGGYALGDFMAYSTNFQPNLMLPIMIGQLTGGIFGVLIAKKVSVPAAIKLG